MADLISREAVKNKIGFVNLYFRAHGQERCLDDLIDEISSVDAVDVVRCEDCDVPHNKWTGCPMLNGLVTPPDFYCGFGERREENAEKT